MRIASLSTALPAHRYSQETLLQAAHVAWDRQLENPLVLDRLFQNVGVRERYLSLPLATYYSLANFGQTNDAWIEHAQQLGHRAVCQALDGASFGKSEIGAIFFVSITGIANPSIDARLLNQIALPRTIKRTPIFGLGCVAGAAGIARAADYVRAFPDQAAILLSVELCSLTVQSENLSMANMIATALFGDGAAAVVISGEHLNSSGPQILATRSSFYPDTEDVMGWNVTAKGFEIVLSPKVPDVIRRYLAADVDSFLFDNALTRKDIGTWIMHTGGPAILEATAQALHLPDSALQASWDCLSRVGNLSSASVLFVLEDFFRNHRPPPSSYSLLAAMGPGFCSELVLLKW